MNWKELEFTDFKINHKTGKKYYQQYLKPSFYIEVYFRWTETDLISQFYHEVLDKLGDEFTYHNNNKKGRDSKFKDRDIAFGYFSDFLKSDKNYCWFQLANAGGVGNAIEIGGAADASFTAWVHKTKESEQERTAQSNKQKALLSEFNTAMLPIGIRISRITISFPMTSFVGPEDFKEWVLNTKLIKTGTFFSGTAGYKINSWEGYVNRDAQNKLKQIVTDYLGLDSDISMGNSMGRFLNEDKSDIIPVIKRLNWLNFISQAGLEYAGGFDALKSKIEKNGISKMHGLNKGACIQVSKEPAISAKDDGFQQYFEIYKSVEKLGYKSHPKDRYWLVGKDDSAVKDWLYLYSRKNVN